MQTQNSSAQVAPALNSDGTHATTKTVATSSGKSSGKPKATAAPAKPAKIAALPKACLPSPGLTTNPESARSIYKALAPHDFFNRGHKLARIYKGKFLEYWDAQQLRANLSDYAIVGRKVWDEKSGSIAFQKGEMGYVDAPMILKSDALRDELRSLEMLHATPLLIESPRRHPKVLKKGYHPELGGKYVFTNNVEKIPFASAKDYLNEVFEGFTFATPADRSRAMAMLLMPAARFGETFPKDFVFPICVVEADDPQTGKGFFLTLIRAVYQETAILASQTDGGVGGLDETVAAALLAGRTFIQLDNIRGEINSKFLEMVLTAPGPVLCRAAHTKNTEVDPRNHVFQLTSNGFVQTRDLSKRCVTVNLRNRPGRTFKVYPEGNILAHIQANQPKFLGAVYSVLSRWITAGKPQSPSAGISTGISEWLHMADWICQNLLDLPSIFDGLLAGQARASSPDLTWLRQVAIAAARTGDVEEVTAADLADISESSGIPIPGSDPRPAMAVGKALTRLIREKEGELHLEGVILKKVTIRDTKKGRDKSLYSFVGVAVPSPSVPVEEPEPDIEVADTSFDEYIDRLAAMEAAGVEPIEPEDLEMDFTQMHENSMAFLELEEEAASILPKRKERPAPAAGPAQFKPTAPLEEKIISLLKKVIPSYSTPKTRGEYVPYISRETGLSEEKIHEVLDEILSSKENKIFLEFPNRQDRNNSTLHYVGLEGDFILAN